MSSVEGEEGLGTRLHISHSSDQCSYYACTVKINVSHFFWSKHSMVLYAILCLILYFHSKYFFQVSHLC